MVDYFIIFVIYFGQSFVDIHNFGWFFKDICKLSFAIIWQSMQFCWIIWRYSQFILLNHLMIFIIYSIDCLVIFAIYFDRLLDNICNLFRSITWRYSQFISIDHSTILASLGKIQFFCSIVWRCWQFTLQGSLAIFTINFVWLFNNIHRLFFSIVSWYSRFILVDRLKISSFFNLFYTIVW